MVAVLSEWWLFYLSGGWCRPLPTTVGTSLYLANHLATDIFNQCGTDYVVHRHTN